jgi:photosystem II stability/assembly factor-like uncharacterized protein
MNKLKLLVLLLLIIPGFAFGQWVEVFQIPNFDPVQAFADNGNGRLYAAATNGVYSTTNNGINWTFSNNGLNHFPLYSITAKDSTCFVGAGLGVYRSTNFGNNWTLQKNGIDSPTVNVVLIVDNFVFAGTLMGIFRSTDNGNYWQQYNNGLPQYPNTRSLVYTSLKLYSGIDALINPNGIYLSTNFGVNWININNNMPNRIPYSLYAYQFLIMAGTVDGVYISTNSGNNWRLINEINGNIGLFGLTSVGTQNIFISAWNYGVFASTNTGSNWVSKNEGLHDLRLTAMYTLNNFVFLGTNPWGYSCQILRRPISEMVPIISNNNEIPKEFILYQNYPNPFNSISKIKYQLSNIQIKNQKVKLIIYNSIGQKEMTLIDKVQGPGIYEVSFDGSNLASGIYFYQLQVNDFMQVKKMVLIK